MPHPICLRFSRKCLLWHEIIYMKYKRLVCRFGKAGREDKLNCILKNRIQVSSLNWLPPIKASLAIHDTFIFSNDNRSSCHWKLLCTVKETRKHVGGGWNKRKMEMFGETIKRKEMQNFLRMLCARKSRHGGTTQCSRILRSNGDWKLQKRKNKEILKETREVKIPLSKKKKKKVIFW